MLIYEYKLHSNQAQYAAAEEAIRVTEFIHNKRLPLWLDTRGTSSNDLQYHCAANAAANILAKALDRTGGRSETGEAGCIPVSRNASGQTTSTRRSSCSIRMTGKRAG